MAPKQRSGRRSAAGATTPVATPSPDVVFEILSWLPAISLTRFRCVCTSWRAMISDPTFLAVHRSRVEPLLVAVTNYVCSPTETTSLQIMDTDGYTARFLDVDGLWKLWASVDGLILLASRKLDNYPAVRVINLATMETVVNFPRPARAGDLVRHVWFGFGRATWSGTLKIIRIVFRSLSITAADCIATCEILTLGEEGGSSGWRQTGSPPAKILDSYDCLNGVTVKGVLHFLFKSQDDILCFDLESEVWSVIRGPRAGSRPSPLEKIGLAELNDTLCITHTKQCTVNLWLLNNKDVWVKAYTISVNHAVGLVPLRVRPDGKLLFYYRRDSMYGLTAVLYVYDPRSGNCTVLENAWDGIVGRIGLCSTRLCGQP